MHEKTSRAHATPEQLEKLVANKLGFVFDLDGTVYLGDDLIPQADRVIEKLRGMGRKTVFLTNKPIASRNEYVEKLKKLGIPCGEDDVINSSLVLARYLSKNYPGAAVYPVAEQPVIRDLEEHGLKISDDPEKIEVVAVSWDRDFHYDKLRIAYEAAMTGAELVATNPDRTCPMPGYRLPDAACMIAAIEACTEREVSPIVGKPSRIMLEEVMGLLDLAPEECAMFGDRLGTDMKMARDAGLQAVLVLTGVTEADQLDPLPPQVDLVVNSIADLLPVLE
ncbi:MAG: HAD-IIA family hydrolase [Planctomycetes bacterium]|nr:HAD-IIA family hydrolase [Planctomycetota bacterium]